MQVNSRLNETTWNFSVLRYHEFEDLTFLFFGKMKIKGSFNCVLQFWAVLKVDVKAVPDRWTSHSCL